MRMVMLLLLFCTTLTLRADWLQENDKIIRTNIIGSTAILTWGYFTWDYGSRSPHFAHEGWFGKDTEHGGMDKLGHLYTTYAATHLFASLYENRYGYSKEEAVRGGAYTAFFLNGVMEIGDSFGDYGYSYEDIVFNALGSYLGYLLIMHPRWDKLVDIRVEYVPSEALKNGQNHDIFTDYEGMKFLAAIKPYSRPEHRLFRYLEFQVGYYARREGERNRRYFFAGVGVNFSKLLSRYSKKGGRLLEFYQVPFGYFRLEDEF